MMRPCRRWEVTVAEKEHCSATVTSQRLHGRIIDEFHRTFESSVEIETYPAFCQITRLAGWPIETDLPGIADGHDIIFPVSGELFHPSDHQPGSQLRAGWKLPALVLSRCEHLHIGSADINRQYVHSAMTSTTPRFDPWRPYPRGCVRSV